MNNIIWESSYPTPVANSTLLPLLLLSLMTQKNAPDNIRTPDSILPEYDVIIVGAGSAGATVANRLSELPSINVLLIEAGGWPPYLTDIPAFTIYFPGSDLDWNHVTVPQKHTGKLLKNRSVPIPTGKGLGGSSILNAMIFVRGNKNDYNHWEAQGAKGWGYKDVRPYFKKLENNTDPKYVANGYHATGGPITVETPKYYSKLKQHLLMAVSELGYKVVDPNGETQSGFYDLQTSTRHGQRCHTSRAYLVPAENRTNLHILTNALVHKIIIENDIAIGVCFESNGKMYEVKAKKEIILSAGGINTPKLLMLSGVGPMDELQKHCIPVIKDLPVGHNFHDHVLAWTNFELDANSNISTVKEKFTDPKNINDYIYNREGIYAAPYLLYLTAFLSDGASNSTEDDPKYQLYFMENFEYDYFLGANGLNISAYEQIYLPYRNKPSYACLVQSLQPKSRGTVRLRSSNPRDPPLVDPNYLAHPEDLENTVKGMKVCHKFADSKHMRLIGAKPFSTPFPGCEHVLQNGTLEAFLTCQAKSEASTGFHPVGTARMGDPNDPTTVVDPLLRVKGIKGLRVVDASVMPTLISGNTNIPTIMIAEKASDIIKKCIA